MNQRYTGHPDDRKPIQHLNRFPQPDTMRNMNQHAPVGLPGCVLSSPGAEHIERNGLAGQTQSVGSNLHQKELVDRRAGDGPARAVHLDRPPIENAGNQQEDDSVGMVLPRAAPPPLDA